MFKKKIKMREKIGEKKKDMWWKKWRELKIKLEINIA